MAGPEGKIPIGNELSAALPGLKAQARAVAQELKTNKAETAKQLKEGKDVSDLLKKNEMLLQKQQRIANKLDEGRAEDIAEKATKQTLRNVRKGSKELREFGELAEGKLTMGTAKGFSHGLESIGGALGMEAEFAALAEAVPYVAAAYAIYKGCEAVYDKVKEFAENPAKVRDEYNRQQADLGGQYTGENGSLNAYLEGGEIRKKLNKQIENVYGGINVSDEEAVKERGKQIDENFKLFDRVAKHGSEALGILRDKENTHLQDLEKRTGLHFEDIKGKFGIEDAFINSTADIRTVKAIAENVESILKERERLETKQKTLTEQMQEDDPSYAVRMRQRSRYLLEFEKEQQERKHDWNAF